MEPNPNLAQDVVTTLDESQAVVVAHKPTTQEPCRSIRICHELEQFGFLMPSQGDMFIREDDEPITYKEVVYDTDSEKWLEAMRSEIDSTYTNQV